MIPETNAWTSVDLYYKGFHVKKSIPANISPAFVIEKIEEYIKLGFEPSWNMDTNKSVQTGIVEDLGVCSKCGAKNLKSKNGNVYCSAKCWLKGQ